MIAAAAIGSMGRELGYGPGMLGALITAYFMTSGIFSAPLGALVERLGWRKALRINATGSALILFLISVSVSNVISLAVLLIMGAALYGFSNPAANIALARHGSPKRLGTLFGIKHAGIPSATLIAGIAIPAVVTPFGWRWAYALCALLALLVLALVPRKEPSSHPQAEKADDIK